MDTSSLDTPNTDTSWIHPTQIYPAPIHPTWIHPAPIHPASVLIHPTSIHPAPVLIHPTSIHPAWIHPAPIHPAPALITSSPVDTDHTRPLKRLYQPEPVIMHHMPAPRAQPDINMRQLRCRQHPYAAQPMERHACITKGNTVLCRFWSIDSISEPPEA